MDVAKILQRYDAKLRGLTQLCANTFATDGDRQMRARNQMQNVSDRWALSEEEGLFMHSTRHDTARTPDWDRDDNRRDVFRDNSDQWPNADEPYRDLEWLSRERTYSGARTARLEADRWSIEGGRELSDDDRPRSHVGDGFERSYYGGDAHVTTLKADRTSGMAAGSPSEPGATPKARVNKRDKTNASTTQH